MLCNSYIRKCKITKKNIGYFFNVFSCGRVFNAKNKVLKTTWSRKAVGLCNAYKFLIYHRKFFRKLFGDVKASKLSTMHKLEFKKFKRRSYAQGFLFTMERRLFSILYRAKIVGKLSYLKQLLLHNCLYVNGSLQKGYSFLTRPLDFVQLKPQNLSSKSCFILDSYSQELLYKVLLIKRRRRKAKKKLYFLKLSLYFDFNLMFQLKNSLYLYSFILKSFICSFIRVINGAYLKFFFYIKSKQNFSLLYLNTYERLTLLFYSSILTFYLSALKSFFTYLILKRFYNRLLSCIFFYLLEL